MASQKQISGGSIPALKRRTLLAGGGATVLAAPTLVKAEAERTLRFVPFVDLSVIDPVATVATPARNHGFLVFDTLYGIDANYRPLPQMVQGHVVEEDGLQWRLVLRDGLRFHDGTPVLARDCVASIRRWMVLDTFGQALSDATAELAAPDDRTIRFRLRFKFPLLPDALAKASPSLCAIMPERLASTSASKPLTEMVGSGPYRFAADEYMPGAKVVYTRFDGYLPRTDGTVSGTAGPKIAHFDRVQWLTLPDPSTAAAALRTGEVDWWETPSPDLLPVLRKDRNLVAELKDAAGLTPTIRFNCIQPPFDNPAIRRAVLQATDQTTMMQAYSDDPALWHVKLGVFCPGTPMANDAGLQGLFGPTDLPRARQSLKDAGYAGQPAVILLPTDHPVLAPLTQVAADLLRQIGVNVDLQSMDTGTLYQRRASREPVEKGGWSCYPSMVSGLNVINPGVHAALRGNGLKGLPGWLTSPSIEQLHEAWLIEEDPVKQRRLCEEMQVQAWADASFIPSGQILQPTAWRRDLSGILDGFAKFWNVRRT